MKAYTKGFYSHNTQLSILSATMKGLIHTTELYNIREIDCCIPGSTRKLVGYRIDDIGIIA